MFLKVLLSVVAVLAARFLWRRWKYDLHKIPTPPGHPLFGHTLDLLRGDGESELNRYIATGWKALEEPEVMKVLPRPLFTSLTPTPRSLPPSLTSLEIPTSSSRT